MKMNDSNTMRLTVTHWLAVLLGLCLLWPDPAHSQDGQGEWETEMALPVIRAARLSEEIILDGILDEEAWSRAQPATVFTQLDPLEGEPGSESTKVFILYDDEAIYIGAILRDRHPVSTRLGRRDGFIMESDWLTISLDTYNDRRTGFKFQVNPSGVRGDEALSGGQDRRGDSSWDPVWEVATHMDEDGWSIEARIPFSQLRFRNQPEQVWGIQITRDIARNRETQLFSFTPKDQAAGIARYGYLVGIEGIKPSRGLEILPYVQGRAEYLPVDQNDDVGFVNPFRDGSDFFYGVGVDLKYRLSSNLTLNATVNPDFGQVEVDPAVVNLTAFETRFQERRPFFVEGAGHLLLRPGRRRRGWGWGWGWPRAGWGWRGRRWRRHRPHPTPLLTAHRERSAGTFPCRGGLRGQAGSHQHPGGREAHRADGRRLVRGDPGGRYGPSGCPLCGRVTEPPPGPAFTLEQLFGRSPAQGLPERAVGRRGYRHCRAPGTGGSCPGKPAALLRLRRWARLPPPVVQPRLVSSRTRGR